MDVSKFLGKAIGIYLVIIALALLFNMHEFKNNIAVLIHDKPVMFLTAFMTLILGILMLISHFIWEWNWRLLITLIACITFVKGTA